MKKEKLLINIDRPIYMAVEQFSDIVKLANVDPENKVCYPTLMITDKASRNGSVYCGPDYINSVEQSVYIQEQLKAGCWFGELTHPPSDCSQERFLTVDHNNISHRICSHVVHGNVITGKVKFVAPKGDILWDWITSGSNIAFSVRVLTPTYVKKKNEQGQTYIYKYGKMIPITYDAVFVPGFREARMLDVDKYDASLENLSQNNNDLNLNFEAFKQKYKDEWKMIEKSTESYSKEEDLKFSDLKTLMRSQETAAILEDVFEFSMEDAKVVLGNNIVNIKISKNKSLKIPTDSFLVSSVLASQNRLESRKK